MNPGIRTGRLEAWLPAAAIFFINGAIYGIWATQVPMAPPVRAEPSPSRRVFLTGASPGTNRGLTPPTTPAYPARTPPVFAMGPRGFVPRN
jgi:hypothetical protein